jgi:hypothetical protein
LIVVTKEGEGEGEGRRKLCDNTTAPAAATAASVAKAEHCFQCEKKMKKEKAKFRSCYSALRLRQIKQHGITMQHSLFTTSSYCISSYLAKSNEITKSARLLKEFAMWLVILSAK